MRYSLTLLLYIGLTISNANAATVFFDDLVGFNSASTTALTDFEGFVADNMSDSDTSYTIDGNTYSSSGGTMVICGKDGCTGSPFDSAAMVAAGVGSMATVRIGLVGGISAIGGLFGDLDGPAGAGTLRVFDSGGLFDSRVVNYGDMGEGLPKTFFGWTTTDTLFTRLEFTIAQNSLWSAVDNIQFGHAENISAIPVPAAVWLFGTALTGFLGISRKRQVA